ncbi:Integrin beta-nu [Habropoda laboriosa]|uniref:Integrin beta n=1 Tax=Habropoda laboriosa TaxID=597456 RepID=A0A0L7R5I8_9HYME|nr:PREDICTED: integrin beta-nu [Habropoda laboriosa]KOC66084.1 Integrin beta-nu [Habropoda laboriosa]
MRIFGKLVLVILLSQEWRTSDAVGMKILKLCISQKTCESCLQASSSCAWCSDWSYSNSTLGRPRCNVPERLELFGCPTEEIRTTSSGSKEVLENSNFQDMAAGRTPIQLRPQRIKVKISSHSKIMIPIHYRLAKNYPLDLYYLMDLTWSMKDDKDTLVSLGWNMSNTFGKITNDFRLGFGSYADKPLMPMTFPGHEDNPCRSEHAVCSPLYSYWHHLRLTYDTEQFIKEVNNSLVTGNVDNLEGALDGLMQSILCTDEVGWAPQARKIILVATDGRLHFAGDGKLGGVVKRPDFKCHLDERKQYSQATNFDYPSLAELSRLLQKRKINLIFAVTEDRRLEYELTAALLQEKARVATLSSDSSNILEIIENSYHQITSKVILRDNSSSPLRVEYFSNCTRKDTSEHNNSECDDIQEGQVYDFNVVLSIDKCPADENQWKQTVVIEDALASEVSKVVIDVDLICGCNCKDSEDSHCEHGTNECGLCKCNFGWSGETCKCDESSLVNNVLQCMERNSTKICSERGECVCGKCFCDEGYKGQFCECTDCDKIDGIECSNQGTCQCGVCQCIEGWQGNACQCPSTDDLCIAPGTEEVCSGHGYCDCGECRCNVTALDELYYRGTYCESTISTGGSGLCVLYNSCANATINEPDRVNEFCQTNVTTYKTEIVKSVDAANEHYCIAVSVKEKTICHIPYVYEFQKNNTVTLKIGDKICKIQINTATISFTIIFGAVFIILVTCLLIWKCWTSIQDKREYEKFILEQKKTVFSLNDNPLFKPATSRFTVPPMYKED